MLRQAIFVVFFASTSGCGPSAPPAIFLGHVADMSGADRHTGKSADLGIRLALEHLGPAASESLFRRPLVVRSVDTGGILDNLDAESARLVNLNRVAGLLGGATRAEAARLAGARVPVLTLCGVRTSDMSEMLFTTGLAPSTQGDVLAKFLMDETPDAGLCVVDPRRAESLECADQFRITWASAWRKKDLSVEMPRWRDAQLPAEGKLVDWAREIAGSKPKALVFVGRGADFEVLRQTWGTTIPILVYAGADGDWTIGSSTPGQKVFIATAFALNAETQKANDFVTKYRERYGEAPDVHAVLAYDNLQLFAEALKKSPAEYPERLRAELLNIKDFPGLTGPLTFAKDQHLRRPAFVARVDGKALPPVALKRYEP